MRITKKQDRMPGIILTILLFVAEIAFTVLLLYTNLLSAKYIGIVFAVLLVLLLIDHLLIRKFRKQIRFWIGIILMVIILAVLGIASFYIYKTVSALDDITGVNKEITEINVYVKQDDAAQSLMDAASYSFGILADLDRENTDTALQQMASETGGEVSTKEYSSLTELADGLLKGDCQAIVLNRAYLDVFDEIDNYASFSSQIREIASEQVEKLVERNTPAPVQTDVQAEDSSDTTQDAAVTDQIYTIFVSGIDTRGDITASSRSDVNIVLTVNARTKQVLMISTPRDYYVPLSISNGVPDKLTHAGIYGINVCMDTLNMLYDTDINYYFRLNFAGFVQIIDALGGITVNSDYDFDSKNILGYHFNKGENYVNGEQALIFARERYAFQEGDRQRGKNQMEVIRGVVKKALSPEILTSYSSILSSLDGCFGTNITYEEIAQILQQQLTNGGDWTIVSYSVNGTGATEKPYSMSQKAYVMVPDYNTVDKAKSLMEKVRNGEVVTQEEADAPVGSTSESTDTQSVTEPGTVAAETATNADGTAADGATTDGAAATDGTTTDTTTQQ